MIAARISTYKNKLTVISWPNYLLFVLTMMAFISTLLFTEIIFLQITIGLLLVVSSIGSKDVIEYKDKAIIEQFFLLTPPLIIWNKHTRIHKSKIQIHIEQYECTDSGRMDYYVATSEGKQLFHIRSRKQWSMMVHSFMLNEEYVEYSKQDHLHSTRND